MAYLVAGAAEIGHFAVEAATGCAHTEAAGSELTDGHLAIVDTVQQLDMSGWS